MNKDILNTGVQIFIENNLNTDILSLALKKSPFPEVSTRELLQQIEGKNKCREKLPSWYNTAQIYYPPKLHLEQSSSEIAAKYKAELVSGETLIDLTGGFGVDCFFFSKKIGRVFYCEKDLKLAEITAHNFEKLKVPNINLNTMDGISALLQYEEKFDWIYLDPSRRNDARSRVFKLADCSPDITEHLEVLMEKTERLLLKTSPLLDLHMGIKELKYVKEIHVVAIRNEVKELQWILEKGFNSAPEIIALNIKRDTQDTFRFRARDENLAQVSYQSPLKFLYEPNAAILKAGAFRSVSRQLQLHKLHKHSHLYTSDTLRTFPGRSFKIEEVIPYSKGYSYEKANVSIRNFPLSVAELRKKHSIKAGGEDYLFFTKDLNEKLIVLHCRKV